MAMSAHRKFVQALLRITTALTFATLCWSGPSFGQSARMATFEDGERIYFALSLSAELSKSTVGHDSD